MNILRILETLAQIPTGLTIDELQDYCPMVTDAKAWAILHQMIDDGTVVEEEMEEGTIYRLSDQSFFKGYAGNGQLSSLFDEINSKSRVIEEKSRQIKQLENDREDLQTKVHHLNHLIDSRDQRIRGLHDEIDSRDQRIRDLHDENGQLCTKTLNEKIKTLEATNKYLARAYRNETKRARAMYKQAIELSDRCDAVIKTIGEPLQGFYTATKGGVKSMINIDWVIKTLEGRQDV